MVSKIFDKDRQFGPRQFVLLVAIMVVGAVALWRLVIPAKLNVPGRAHAETAALAPAPESQGAAGTIEIVADSPVVSPEVQPVPPAGAHQRQEPEPLNVTETGSEALALFQQGRAALGYRDMLAARKHLSAALASGLPTPQDAQARKLLNQAADVWLFSRYLPTGDEFCRSYRVVAGDRLVQIGRKFAVSHELLMRINGISDAKRLAAGSLIKVVQGPFHLKIDRRRFLMGVYLGDILVRSYPLGLGAAGRETPTGQWLVKVKTIDPEWPDRETGRLYRSGDPENPLGSRWISLEGLTGPAKGRSGFGIHGTIKPDEIGKAASRGCIRLHNKDVEELYDLVTPNKTTVTVLDN